MPRGDRTFNANIISIQDEISSSLKWGRPSILISIANDHWVKMKSMAVLEKALTSRKGVRIEKVDFASLRLEQIVPALQAMTDKDAVYFVTNLLDVSSTDTFIYRAINMQRETLIEQNTKIIFFLTKTEADLLPTHALDFWAFRHQVYVFFDSRNVKNTAMGARMLLWGDGEESIGYQQLSNELQRLRSEIVIAGSGEVPRLLGLLAKTYWKLDDLEQSRRSTEEGMAACQQRLDNDDHINLWTSMAAHAFLSGDLKLAQNHLEEAMQAFKEKPFIALNLALLLLFTPRKKSGIDLAIKVAGTPNIDPVLVGQAGYICFLSGDLHASKRWFELACASSERFETALAICLGRIKNTPQSLDRPSSHPSALAQACLALAGRNTSHAIDFLRREVQQKRESAGTLLNNPNLWISVYPDDLKRVLKEL